jgi:hypothetical protein
LVGWLIHAPQNCSKSTHPCPAELLKILASIPHSIAQNPCIHTPQDCSKLLKTAQNCSKLLKTAQNCSKLLKTAQNCSKLLKTAQTVVKRVEINVYDKHV